MYKMKNDQIIFDLIAKLLTLCLKIMHIFPIINEAKHIKTKRQYLLMQA